MQCEFGAEMADFPHGGEWRELVKEWGLAPAMRKIVAFSKIGRSQSPFFHKALSRERLEPLPTHSGRIIVRPSESASAPLPNRRRRRPASSSSGRAKLACGCAAR